VYSLNVPTKQHVIATLHQEDERIHGALPRRPYIDLGIAVLRMDKEEGSQLLTYKDFMIQRDLEIEMILEPG
jgi:hypothetical protein